VKAVKAPEGIFGPETDEPDLIRFPNRFPVSLSRSEAQSTPVVVFTYVDSERVGLGPFIKHLRTYRRLFAALRRFQFVYVSTASKEQEEAAELFALLIQGSGLADLKRYFDLKTKWDNKQYGQVSEKELVFLSESRKRYTGEIFGTLYYLWKRNQLPKDLRAEDSSNQNCT
jgi:hypothetical protein